MIEGKFNIGLVNLDNINIISTTLENRSGIKSVDRATMEMTFQYELTPSVSIRSKQIRVTADYEVKVGKTGSKEADIYSKYVITFLFSINNLHELTESEKDSLTIDEELLASLFNITYSTSRGILYTRYLGTVLDGILLPAIATADLFKPAVKPIP